MKKLLLLLSILYFYLNVAAQNQKWNWLTPYPTGSNINKVYFISPTTGFILGDEGTLLKTTDSGISWEQAAISSKISFSTIYFIDSTKGWVAGFDNYTGNSFLYNTTNAGTIWIQQNLQDQYSAVRSFFFLDSLNGWICGNGGLLYKTTNEGKTWGNKSLGNIANADFIFIHFSSPDEGIIIGNDYSSYFSLIVGKTTNGGNSWEIKQSGFRSYLYDCSSLNNSSFISVGELGIIIKTTDNGSTWFFKTGLPLDILSAVDFYDSLSGISVSGTGSFMRTTDGGISWHQSPSGFSTVLTSVQYVTDKIIYAGGLQQPVLLLSTDKGETWSNKMRAIDNLFSIQKVFFTSPQNGWIVGNNFIYKSSDGGLNCSQYSSNFNEYYNDILFVDSLNGLLCGYRNNVGIILRTTDAGSSWQSQSFDSFWGIGKLSFPQHDSGFALCYNGIIKTTNMGQSWSTILNLSSENYTDLKFLNSKLGFVLSDHNIKTIKKTIDGGLNWTTYNITYDGYLRSISFPNENVGYAAGNNLFKTTNGGVKWTQVSLPIDVVDEVLFVDENTGWITSYGGIYSTTNGGNSWNKETAKGLNHLSITNNSLYAYGDNSCIMKYSGDIPVGIEGESKSILPDKFSLNQNYPNPFNPSTTINYDVPVKSHVLLKVFNVLGEEVTTLINEEKISGRYNFKWNASNIVSGVYFYRIEMKSDESPGMNFIDTKKLILVK